jgi:hypothetical protein
MNLNISTQTIWTFIVDLLAVAGQVFGVGSGIEHYLILIAGAVTSSHVLGLHLRKAASVVAGNAAHAASQTSQMLSQVGAALGTTTAPKG